MVQENQREGCTRLCKVDGCCVDLLAAGHCYWKRKICPKHMRCGKLQPLQEFDSTKRSCRTSLERRRVGADDTHNMRHNCSPLQWRQQHTLCSSAAPTAVARQIAAAYGPSIVTGWSSAASPPAAAAAMRPSKLADGPRMSVTSGQHFRAADSAAIESAGLQTGVNQLSSAVCAAAVNAKFADTSCAAHVDWLAQWQRLLANTAAAATSAAAPPPDVPAGMTQVYQHSTCVDTRMQPTASGLGGSCFDQHPAAYSIDDACIAAELARQLLLPPAQHTQAAPDRAVPVQQAASSALDGISSGADTQLDLMAFIEQDARRCDGGSCRTRHYSGGSF